MLTMAIRVFPRYPHMGPEESRIWHKFLATTSLRFIKIEYDVRVGPGYMPTFQSLYEIPKLFWIL